MVNLAAHARRVPLPIGRAIILLYPYNDITIPLELQLLVVLPRERGKPGFIVKTNFHSKCNLCASFFLCRRTESASKTDEMSTPPRVGADPPCRHAKSKEPVSRPSFIFAGVDTAFCRLILSADPPTFGSDPKVLMAAGSPEGC